MKLTSYSRASLLAISTLAAIWAAGCSDEDPAVTEGSGGTDVGGAGGKATGVGGKAAGGANVGGGTVAQGGGVVGGATNGGATGVGGGTIAQGGVTGGGAGTGGAVTAGAGGTATGGTSGSGTAGAAGAGCGTTPSTVIQDWAFAGPSLPTGWVLAGPTGGTAPTVTFVTTPAICAGGCAAIAFTVPAGTGWGGPSSLQYEFTNLANLYGASIVATVALDVPSANVAGTSLQVFDQGGGTNGWAWGVTVDMPATQRGVTTQLFDVELKAANNASTGHCASTEKRIGIQVQRSADAAAAFSGTLYVKNIRIVPPGGATGGTAGAAGAAGAPSTGTAGGGGTAGTTGTTDVAGSAGASDVAGSAGTAGSG